MPKRVKDGFSGQKTIVLPKQVVQKISTTQPISTLFITDIGYFPHAEFHYVRRDNGSRQNILIYCIYGEGWYIVEKKHQRVAANQFFIIPSNKIHRYGAKAGNPWSIYWIHFSGSKSNFILSSLRMDNNVRTVNVSGIDDRIRIFNEIYNTLENGYSTENIGYANMCLWHFLGSFIYDKQFKDSRNYEHNDIVSDTIKFMKKNLTENLSLKDMSNNINLSTSHFSAIFKKQSGFSPIDYFSRMKIQKACQYLDLTNSRVNEIADILGYNDPYYFSRIFHKIMGQSPREYRSKQKG